MEFEEKERLARVNDMGLEACAIRLRAARKVSGRNQKDLASAAGVSKTVLNNAEAALTYPSRDVLKYLYRSHRIDFNFMMNGNFSQLPGDVQDTIFPALEAAESDWGQRASSNQTRKIPKPSPAGS